MSRVASDSGPRGATAGSLPEQTGSAADWDDAALVARARQDKSRFDAIYERYSADVGTFLRRMLIQDDVIADAVHETFIRAMLNLHKLRDPGCLKAWLFGIAANVRSSEIRDQRRRRLSFKALAQLVTDCVAAPGASGFDHRDVGDALRCFERLSAAHREVFVLHEVYGFSVAHIASALSLREGTVKSRLARAKASLSLYAREKAGEQ